MKEQISCSALCSLFAEDACCGAERKDTCMAAGGWGMRCFSLVVPLTGNRLSVR